MNTTGKHLSKNFQIGVLRRRWREDPSGAYARNILHRVPEAEYVPVNDVFSRLAQLTMRINAYARRLIGKALLTHFNLNNQFYRPAPPKVDVIHLFNGVSYNRVPWVSTFETAVPRFLEVMKGLQIGSPRFNQWQNWRFNLAAQALASQSCLAIMPISQNAARAQRLVISWMPEHLAASIEAKIVVLPPPQNFLVASMHNKKIFAPIRFMFVGHDFFREGGMEMLESFLEIRRAGYTNFTLTIVSALRGNDYATGASAADVERARSLIRANAEWIEYHPSLPHTQVLQLMKQAHVGLLPTYADSYGYSVLEFQAAGCPTITTTTGALTEINGEERGWLIQVPTDHIGRAPYYTAEGKSAIRQRIRAALPRILKTLLNNPQQIYQKGQAALEYIRAHHDPNKHAQALRAIYSQARQHQSQR